MAHTIQTYGDRTEYFNDVHLLIIISMVIDYINEYQSIYPSLVESLKHWEESVVGYAPGVIELDLDRNLNEDAARNAFLSVISEVQAKLASIGDLVPVEFLRSLAMFDLWEGNYEIIRFFEPFPANRLLAAAAALEKLVGEA